MALQGLSVPANGNRYVPYGERAGNESIVYFTRDLSAAGLRAVYESTSAQPVVTPNVGILASTDILAVDQACVDLVYAMAPEQNHDLVERIESRHGLRQLSYMKELGMGNDRYVLIDLDNGRERIWPHDAVADVVPFEG